MKKLTIIFILLTLQIARAASPEADEITFLGRIESQGTALRVIHSLEGDAIPAMLQNQQLEKTLKGLQKGDEVLIKGHVSYEAFSLEGGVRPIFVVQSIKPISLSRLGNLEGTSIPNDAYSPSITKIYSPLAIPVTTEVASAITLTSSMLLLQSLTSTGTEPETKQQLDSGLILFAGIMATGIFIYEQIVGTKNKGSNND